MEWKKKGIHRKSVFIYVYLFEQKYSKTVILWNIILI